MHRRKFLSYTGKAMLSLGLSNAIINSFAQSTDDKRSTINFTQQPLPYSYTALEPYIDAQTMEIHYSKHAATYQKNVTDALKDERVDASISIEHLLKNISKYSPKMRNNAGGHYNHELFWQSMTNDKSIVPSEKLKDLFTQSFGSFDKAMSLLSDAAKQRFGSGWAWIIVNPDKKLVITSTPNQDNTLMDIAEQKGTPILGIDVWEHAYYLKYQNKRADYITNWLKVVNWNVVEQRLKHAI